MELKCFQAQVFCNGQDAVLSLKHAPGVAAACFKDNKTSYPSHDTNGQVQLLLGNTRSKTETSQNQGWRGMSAALGYGIMEPVMM